MMNRGDVRDEGLESAPATRRRRFKDDAIALVAMMDLKENEMGIRVYKGIRVFGASLCETCPMLLYISAMLFPYFNYIKKT